MIRITMTIMALCVFLAPMDADATSTAAALAKQTVGNVATPGEPFVVVAETSSSRPMQASNQSIDMRDDEYDSSYLFGMTKGVSHSSLTPALKPLVFLVTVPLDILLLPFAAIGGFF